MNKLFLKRMKTSGMAMFLALILIATPVLADGTYSATISSDQFWGMPVALQGRKSHNGAFVQTMASGKLSWVGSWSNTCLFSGTTAAAYTKGDAILQIVHEDVFSCKGIGSVDVGYKTIGCSVDGSTATYTYKANNTSLLVQQPSYTISKFLTFSAKITCRSTFKMSKALTISVVPGEGF